MEEGATFIYFTALSWWSAPGLMRNSCSDLDGTLPSAGEARLQLRGIPLLLLCSTVQRRRYTSHGEQLPLEAASLMG